MFSLIIYILIALLGFMMGVLYKRTNTTAKFFNPDPRTILKLFLVAFTLAIISTYALSYLAPQQLRAAEVSADGVIKYQNIKSIMYFVINFFFFSLIILANGYSQASRKISFMPYLLTIGYYVLFIMKDAYYLSDYYLQWQKSFPPSTIETTDFHHLGWMKSFMGAAATLFNTGMIWWGLNK